MSDNENTCKEHSGCLRDIINLEKENMAQWSSIKVLEVRMLTILSRLNVILGGIVVACVLLLINILLTKID